MLRRRPHEWSRALAPFSATRRAVERTEGRPADLPMCITDAVVLRSATSERDGIVERT